MGAFERFAADLEFRAAEVNGETAPAAWSGDTLVAVAVFEVRDGRIAQVRSVVNPDKLEFVRRQLTPP